MSRIELKHIDKYYGSNHVLKDLSLSMENGEFITLLGPSGCGKTTTLRVIAGLEKPESGTVEIDGRIVVDADVQFFELPGKRGLNLVFQSYALWPHMTVFQNVAFGLDVQKVNKQLIQSKVVNALERMHISEFAHRYPSELSGGQQQRVAIARAIVTEPKVLLLDEPLSNLDAKLRLDMRSELKRLHHEMGTTIVYVTHDQVEALTLSTRIAIFFDGMLEQVDSPMDLYQNPASLRVANFIGNPRINFIDCRATRTANGDLQTVSLLGVLTFPKELLTDDIPTEKEFDGVLGIHPEKIRILSTSQEQSAEGTIYSVQPAGSETTMNILVGETNILVKEMGIRNYKPDQNVMIHADSTKITVFDKQTGRLIKRAISD